MRWTLGLIFGKKGKREWVRVVHVDTSNWRLGVTPDLNRNPSPFGDFEWVSYSDLRLIERFSYPGKPKTPRKKPIQQELPLSKHVPRCKSCEREKCICGECNYDG